LPVLTIRIAIRALGGDSEADGDGQSAPLAAGTFALLYGRVSVYTLAVNMGTSVDMIEKYYGHVKPLQAHKELTARYKI